MGQYWIMFNLSGMYLFDCMGTKLGEAFMVPNATLESILKGDIFRGTKYIPLHNTRYKSIEPNPQTESSLLRSPNEILSAIMLHIKDDVDRYCLGLCCIRLFSLVEDKWLSHITDKYNAMPPRVIAVGDYATWGSLPPHCYDRAREARLFPIPPPEPGSKSYNSWDPDAEDLENPYEAFNRASVLPGSGSRALNHILGSLGKKVWARLLSRVPQEQQADYAARFANSVNRKKHLAREELSKVPDADILYHSLLLHRKEKPSHSSKNHSYVLRNLSKKAFVLENPFCTTFTEASQGSGEITMTQVVLSQCCRSEDPSVSMVAGGELVQGPWAGDEMDMVTETEFLRSFQSGEENPKEWTNDGARIYDLMLEIVESELQMDDRNFRSRLIPGETVEDLLKKLEMSKVNV